MKYYLFAVVCLLASIAELIWRPFPGWGCIGIAYIIWLISVISTAAGVKNDVDDLWWRMAISVITPIIIAFGSYQ